MNDEKESYSVYEMADRMNVSHTTIYSWIERGLKSSVQFHGLKKRTVLTQEDVDDFLRDAINEAAQDFK